MKHINKFTSKEAYNTFITSNSIPEPNITLSNLVTLNYFSYILPFLAPKIFLVRKKFVSLQSKK